ncbi:MAG: DsbA family protein [Chloroflexi bacterium]|nr:DsbA family protein [Chloroflexota bacterium]
MTALDFYFDVSCRWAWWASIWLRRIVPQRSLEVTWKVFSLAVQDNPDNYREPPARPHHIQDVDLHRSLVAARRAGGQAALDRLYLAYGNVIHADRGDVRDPAIQRQCLSAAGLPLTLFDDAQRDPATEAELVADTRAALALGVLGTPTLALAGSDATLLGPVLGAVPAESEALELWTAVEFALRHPYVYELKRNRDKGTPENLRAD